MCPLVRLQMKGLGIDDRVRLHADLFSFRPKCSKSDAICPIFRTAWPALPGLIQPAFWVALGLLSGVTPRCRPRKRLVWFTLSLMHSRMQNSFVRSRVMHPVVKETS